MIHEVCHSVSYSILLGHGTAGTKFSTDFREDAFGNLILYSLEEGIVTIFANSLMEVNMTTEELITQLSDCIIHSLKCGYYDPQLIIYKSERNSRNVTKQKEIEGNVSKRIIRFSERISVR